MNRLFKERLDRLSLISLMNDVDYQNYKKIKIHVYRNHSFELISSVMNAFLGFSNIYADFSYSDYDDSFNFVITDSDILVLWVDVTKYYIENLNDFFAERLSFLRKHTNKPILFFYLGELNDFKTPLSDLYIFNVEKSLDLGSGVFDLSKEEYTGTKLSNQAMLQFSRFIGMQILPSLLLPNYKAVVVDLDNTLYKGVLGEDGIDALVPNLLLQKMLKELKENGFFLCISSKNIENDVVELFKKRNDFILKYEDFTVAEISWKPKSDGIINIAKKLNIFPDAMLFIDDNIAEIENVKVTGVKTILADENVNQVIKYYPRLMKLRQTDEDLLRSKDIIANLEREKLKSLSPVEYFKNLDISLHYFVNNLEHRTRIVELLGKTNQFILSYKRYKESEVNEFLIDENKCYITLKMADKLSDSGIIAILLAEKFYKGIIVKELTVSCRALGRNLENIMLPYLLKLASDVLKTDKKVFIEYKRGPRNFPAISWLEQLSGAKLEEEGVVEYVVSDNICLDGLKVEVSF